MGNTFYTTSNELTAQVNDPSFVPTQDMVALAKSCLRVTEASLTVDMSDPKAQYACPICAQGGVDTPVNFQDLYHHAQEHAGTESSCESSEESSDESSDESSGEARAALAESVNDAQAEQMAADAACAESLREYEYTGGMGEEDAVAEAIRQSMAAVTLD